MVFKVKDELVVKEVFKKRLLTCNECVYFNKDNFQCNDCGCNMLMKAMLKTTTCPKNKWDRNE